MNDLGKNLLLCVIVAVVLLAVFQSFGPRVGAVSQDVQYSQFLSDVHNDAIKRVEYTSDGSSNVSTMNFERKDGSKAIATGPYDRDLINDLLKHNVEIAQEKPSTGPSLLYIIINLLPYVIFIGIFVYFLRQISRAAQARVR